MLSVGERGTTVGMTDRRVPTDRGLRGSDRRDERQAVLARVFFLVLLSLTMSGEAVPDSEEEDSDFVPGACSCHF